MSDPSHTPAPAEDAEALKARKDSIRLKRPDPAMTLEPVSLTRMRSLPGEGALEFLPEDDRPEKLTIPAGAEGNAERLLGRGDTAGALAISTVLLAGDDPSDESPALTTCVGRTIRVRALLMEGKLEEAIATLGTARDAQSLALADAAISLVEGNLTRAVQRLDQAMAARADGIAEHYTLALVHLAHGNTGEGVQALMRVCAADPQHAVARHQLGRVMLSEGDPARAGTLFEQAYEISRAFVAPALTLAEMFIESRQYGEAMNLLNDVADAAPSLLTPRVLQLRIFVEARRTPAALQLGEALRQAAPEREDVLILWAEALMQAEQTEMARQVLEDRMAQGDVQDPLKILRMLTRMDLQARPPRVESAIKNLRAAVEVDTSGGEVAVELAQLQLAARRTQDAVETLEKLMQSEEVELGVLLSAAVLANKHGMGDLARRIGEEAVGRVAGTPAEAQLRTLMETLG